jgi:ATP/maltotriose-dependent transcriptional regulator MalT/DNA-binding SARP family transcriptional activator
MNNPMTRTKYVLPRRRTDLLTRPRLLALLQDLLDEKLVILAAPAGYGKTSLLIDLAYHTEMPVCWYALDPLDRELNRFINYFIASISQRFPTFGRVSRQALQNLSTDSSGVEQIVTTIVNEIYECIQEHFLIVLDDYHFVNDQEEINQFIGRFLQEMDENCHLVISSRTLLTLPDLPLMVARSQVGGLGFSELQFKADEIRQLIEQNYNLVLPENDIEDLTKESEGWITGLLLSTQAQGKGMTDRLRLARVSAVGLYDYLAEQVLEQQTPAVRDFLLRTSPLEEFDVDLCEAVLGPLDPKLGETWQSLMDALMRNNLFVLPVGEKGLWLRYHHLFRDFLQSRLNRDNPGEEARIIKTLAAVYTQKNEWDKAFDLYKRLNNTEGMLTVIENAGSGLLKNGRLSTLAGWIDSLPIQNLSTYPTLLSLRGSVDVMQGQVERGLALLNASVESFRKTNSTDLLAQTLPRRAHAFQFLGDYKAAIQDADEAIQITQHTDALWIERALAFRARGLCLYSLGQWDEAIVCLKEAIGIYETVGATDTVALVKIDLGSLYFSMGEFNQAKMVFDSALNYLIKAGDLARESTVLNNLGVLNDVLGNYEQAADFLEHSLARAQQSGFTRMEVLAYVSIGDLYRKLDANQAAEKAYSRAQVIAEKIGDNYLLYYLHIADAQIYEKKGDFKLAMQSLQKSAHMAETSHSAFEMATVVFEEGQYALRTNDLPQAIEKFGHALDDFSSGDHLIEKITAHFYLADAWYRNGNETLAIENFKAGYFLSERLENPHPLISCLREVRPIFDLALKKPELKTGAAEMIDLVQIFEKEIPTLRRRIRKKVSVVPFSPPSLVIHTLGRTQVLLDGKPVSDFGSGSQAARDLFYLLLANTDGLKKETIGGLLWADSPTDQLKLQFKNAVYRLRRSLEQDVVILDGEYYRFNHALDYEYDVESFEHTIRQADSAASTRERIKLLATAADIYKGDYLPEMQGAWLWPERSRLHEANHNLLMKLAELYLGEQNYEEALSCSQRLLAGDPGLEEAHRTAMRAYAGLGNTVAVVRQFELCQQMLLKEVNLPPSEQTLELLEALIH